ncbi:MULTISPECIES: LCP family protein [Actinosynnema]|uniref:LCP family protein n=1 Tax=Actinosynnema TaxID=40566 RepID=UPI0020A4B1DB|nr:LCP family protein [Actinosynnema pretiosum]MCP2099645.1 transcriptional attenuator, LytR family [Actinosynnema pretiosum]
MDGSPPGRTGGSAALRVLVGTGRTLVALVSAAVLVVTWYGWHQLRTLNQGVTTTDVFGEASSTVSPESTRKPLDGAIDILLVGSDSRTDQQGNPLPDEALALLNGGVDEGTLNTDTIILVHVPQDGTRAVAISFPRDSYVEIADGFGKHKINSALVRQKNTTSAELQAQGVTDLARIEQESMLAGRRTLIKTIEDLSGGAIKIDRYAEVNLASFYEVTKAIGGVEVCLNNPVDDEYYSGAKFPAGVQTLSGREALQFVRQRHELPNGDLDRIVRQQVFIGALARKVLSTGTLTDPTKLTDLVSAVQKSVVLSQGWDVTEFASQMQGLASGKLEFRTIPVGPPTDTYSDGNVLPVDAAEVKAFLGDLASDKPKPSSSSSPSGSPSPSSGPQPSAITVQVYNSSGVSGVALKVLNALGEQGFRKGQALNASVNDTTVVRYGTGQEAYADRVVQALGGNATTELDDSVPRGQVLIYVGADNAELGTTDDTSSARSETGSSSPASSTAPITANGVVCVD